MLDDLPDWATYLIPLGCYLLVLATVPVYGLIERRDLRQWRAAADELGAEFRVFSWTGYKPQLVGVLDGHSYKVWWGIRSKTSTEINYHVSVNNPSLPNFHIVSTSVIPPLRRGRRQKTGDEVVDKAMRLYSNDDRVLAYMTPPVLDLAGALFNRSKEARFTNDHLQISDPTTDAGAVRRTLHEVVALAASISVPADRSAAART